jgi:hypothetical protein
MLNAHKGSDSIHPFKFRTAIPSTIEKVDRTSTGSSTHRDLLEMNQARVFSKRVTRVSNRRSCAEFDLDREDVRQTRLLKHARIVWKFFQAQQRKAKKTRLFGRALNWSQGWCCPNEFDPSNSSTGDRCDVRTLYFYLGIASNRGHFNVFLTSVSLHEEFAVNYRLNSAAFVPSWLNCNSVLTSCVGHR